MTFQIIRRETCPIVQWKNGAGWTTNLLTSPPNAGWDQFSWRVSLARLDKKSNYSLFEGVGRIQLLLSGRGLLIKSAIAQHYLKPGQSLSFSGDESVEVEPDGQCEALNVMFRHYQYVASHEIYRADFVTRLSHADYVLYVADGTCTISQPDGSLLILVKGELLHIRHDGYMLEASTQAGSLVVVIRFSKIQEHHAS